MASSEGYNGWKNWETWNVALWISNDEGLYRLIQMYHDEMQSIKALSGAGAYTKFILWAGLNRSGTPDGAAYLAKGLDYARLDEFIRDGE